MYVWDNEHGYWLRLLYPFVIRDAALLQENRENFEVSYRLINRLINRLEATT